MIFPAGGIPGTPKTKILPEDLERLSPALQDELAGLQYLLNPFQVRHLLKLQNDSLRMEWIETYWKSQDPTPITPYNEKRIEHTVRARLARQFFKLNRWPGWDKRGEVFIRYGPPDYRGKIWGEITARKMRPPGELWFYKRHNMLVSFQNFGLKGEYIYSLNPLGAAQDASPELIEYLLYDTDQSITSKIPQYLLEFYASPMSDEDIERAIRNRDAIGGPTTTELNLENRPRIRDIPESIDDIMDRDYKSAVPKDVSLMFHRDEVEEIANNFEKVLEETPSSYPFNFAHKPFPFYFSIDQFKGGEGINRVEVNIEVPIVAGGEDASQKEESFKATAVVWNTQYKELSRSEMKLVLKKEDAAGEWMKLIPTQLVFSLEEGYYRIGIAVEAETRERSTTYRTSVSSEKFGGRLAISDILFASKIERLTEPSLWSRGALQIIPHPLRAYKKSFSVPVYFETYNLGLDERGVSSFTVQYKVVPHTKKKRRFWDRFEKETPVVSSSFQASGYSPDETQFFRLGTDNLWEGTFDLLVTVSDEINRTTAYRKATFTIIE